MIGQWVLYPAFRFVYMNNNNLHPFIQRSDRILVNRIPYWFHEPKRGDIVWYKTGELSDNPLMDQYISSNYDMTILRMRLVDVENTDDAFEIVTEVQKIVDQIEAFQYQNNLMDIQ